MSNCEHCSYKKAAAFTSTHFETCTGCGEPALLAIVNGKGFCHSCCAFALETVERVSQQFIEERRRLLSE